MRREGFPVAFRDEVRILFSFFWAWGRSTYLRWSVSKRRARHHSASCLGTSYNPLPRFMLLPMILGSLGSGTSPLVMSLMRDIKKETDTAF